MIGLQRIEVEGKRFVLLEEGEYERLWTCIQAEVRRLLGRDDILPGMVAAIQTHGKLLHWHPHIHTLVTCGGFTPEGDFLEVHELDMDRLHAAWREAVFALYLAEDKIKPEVVENMRTWGHSGFSVDQSVFLPAGDLAGIQRLMQYMTRCPFSLSRLTSRPVDGTHMLLEIPTLKPYLLHQNEV